MRLLEGLRGENRGGDLDAEKLVLANSQMRVEESGEITGIHHFRPKTASAGRAETIEETMEETMEETIEETIGKQLYIIQRQTR